MLHVKRRVAVGGATVAACAALAIAVPGLASAQTVTVGSGQVPVAANGTVDIDGTAIPVPAGFTGHVALVTPPSGATATTVDGQVQYGLPSGATGESFNLLPATSTASTVQAVATDTPLSQSLISSGTVQSDASVGGVCDLEADEPFANGDQQIQGDSYIDCTTDHALVIDLNSTTYELLDSWKKRGSGDTDGGENELLEAEAKWHCDFGTTHTWHTRANAQVEDFTDDWIYGWYINSKPRDATCR